MQMGTIMNKNWNHNFSFGLTTGYTTFFRPDVLVPRFLAHLSSQVLKESYCDHSVSIIYCLVSVVNICLVHSLQDTVLLQSS